jgi:protein-L-isoaspartate(D-aspartate) O-methyltransferase
LPLQHSYARSLQAMDFMKQLPQSEEMRRHMVDSQLRTSGVNAPWIIAAMLATPREAFVPGDSAAVYMDRAVPLANARMLNPPLAAGLMLSTAEPGADDKVLLIGAATGYLAALLAPRVASLVAVEEAGPLADMFRSNLPAVTLVTGPLAAGALDNGPYDLIMIDGGIEQLPDALVEQLVEGGRIVTGLLEGPVSRLATGVKHGAHLALRPVIDTEIAPLPGFQRTKEFVF